MLQITPQMRLLVAIEPVDFRKGIDGLVAVCKHSPGEDPLRGAVFAFRNRRATAVKVLAYDGQGEIRHVSMASRSTPDIIELETEQTEALLCRMEAGQLTGEDVETLRAALQSYLYVTQLIDQKSTTIARLRKLLFGAETEKTAAVTGRAAESPRQAAPTGSVGRAAVQVGPRTTQDSRGTASVSSAKERPDDGPAARVAQASE